MKNTSAHIAAILLNRLRSDLAKAGDSCTGAVYIGEQEERDGRVYYGMHTMETGIVWMAQGVAGRVANKEFQGR